MKAFDAACLAVAVLVPILGGVATKSLGFGPALGVILGVAALVAFTKVVRP